MVLSPNDALKELEDIRINLDKINQKSYRFWQKGKKREEIRKLVETLDVVLRSSDMEYEKGEVVEKAPKPTTIHAMDVEQDVEATSAKWSKYLSDQLDLYRKRIELLAKSPPISTDKTEKSQATQVIENIGTYIHYNPEVNINTIIQNIDHVISELEKEPNLDSKEKEEIKSKLQQAKEFIKKAANEATPLAGKFVGQVLHSFLFGNEK